MSRFKDVAPKPACNPNFNVKAKYSQEILQRNMDAQLQSKPSVSVIDQPLPSDSAISVMVRREQLEQQQQLLREYYFWASASDSDIARALESSGSNVFSGVEFGEDLHIFMTKYADNPQGALSTKRHQGQQRWTAMPKLDTNVKSTPTDPTAAEHVVALDGVMDDSDRMDVDTHNKEDEFDTDHLTHPDDIVFQSQLDPVSVAQVLSKLSVHDAEVLENPMVYYSYQDQIEDLNSKSANMYNWMLHAQEQPLYKVVGDSNKLLETRDWDTARDELIRVRVMERIEELKEQGKWSFWQPRRHRAPPRSKAHWDHVLAEMAWMHTDFAEERKLKVATARMLASWVMDYHQAMDKSRYTVNGKRRMLSANFVNSKAGDSADSMPAEDADMADSEDQLGSSPESLGEPDEVDEDEDGGETTDGESSTATGEAAAVPSSAAGSASDRDTSETPLEALIKTEPNAEPLAQSKGVGDEGVNGFAAGAGLESVEDHVVPSGADKFDRPVLSVYQILAQLPDALGIEEILGNSVYALQALGAFVPFSPAWEEPYCDILDISPVVPICKTMWDDVEDEDDAFAGLDTSEDTIDMHELIRLNSEDLWRTRTADSELPGPRSVFTRNMLAPPLLPIFTQANKQQRITHSSIGQPPVDTQIQQAASEACPGQAVFEWTAERDRMLAKLVQQYTGNWRLIAESFNHASKLYGSRSVTSRVCFERWAAIKDDYSLDRSTIQTGFDEPDYNRSRKQQNWSSQLAIHPMVPQLSAMQLATSLVSHSEAHKIVNESKKKRESAATPAAVPPREIKPMAADQKVPTPAELSKLKFDNDRRLQQLFMEQRQATAAAAALAMQQQRSMNPQMQAFQLNRQIAVLQAMLASGRGLQRPLTPAQSRTIQQQLHNFQLMQQQQQAQQAQNSGMLARPPLPQQAAQASPQLQAVQSPQPQMPGLGQLPGGLGLPQQAQSPALPNGSQGMRLTPEQIQQFLQARSANGVRPGLSPALAAILNARAAALAQQQQQAGVNGNGRPPAMNRPLNPAAVAAAAANMLPHQRQMILQQLAQQQQQQQQQIGQQQQQHMQRPSGMASPPPSMMPMALSPQVGAPAIPQQQQSLAPVAAPGPHNLGMSTVPGDPTHTLHTSPVPSSMPNPQMPNLPGSTPVSGALPGSGAGMTPAQAQAFLASQQALQFKQMQGQQMQGQPMQGQPMQTQAAANQPQLAQYLSGLFPHQLAQLSNQQRMNFMMMRQLQQQQQQQPQQFAGMTQPNTLQALQQSLMASAAGSNGLAAGSPVSQQQQQMLLAQLAQNMNNQQMLKSTTQPPAQASPRPQVGLNQLQLMRMRQQQQQQQLGSAAPGFSMPSVSSPVMVNQATPSLSTPHTFPAPQAGNMSPPLHSSGSPPANTQPMMSPRPPQAVVGMQPSQQAMMLAAATAAGLSASAAQALIVQIAANAESNAQQTAPVPAQVSPRPINSSASPVSTAQPHAMSVQTPQRTLSSTSNVSSGAVTPSARPVTPQLSQRPSVRPALRPHTPRPSGHSAPGQPVQRSVRPGMRPPPGALRRPVHPGHLSLPAKSPVGSAKGSASSRGSTPSTPVKSRPHVSPSRSTQATASPEQAQPSPDSSK
ncbi:chromatin modification- protein VID21 [Coemansia sp. RSA 2131]|nr:chromatin modification- protein VID21 [Coemansia sp. RSA 2131]